MKFQCYASDIPNISGFDVLSILTQAAIEKIVLVNLGTASENETFEDTALSSYAVLWLPVIIGW